MNMNEYLDTLSEQIRCKKARPLVIEEIRNHIEDQAEAYQKDGMEQDAAMEKAIADMGDPVQTGVELDKVHRPKMQWSLIIIAAILSLFGMITQIVVFQAYHNSDPALGHTIAAFITHAVIYTLIGILVMIGVCLLDYTFFGKHPVALWIALCALSFLYLHINEWSWHWIYRFDYYFLTLLIPAFAAVVFHYRTHRLSGLLKCIGFALLGLFCAGEQIMVSVIVEYVFSVLIILTAAVLKGWFVPLEEVRKFKKKGGQLALLWLPVFFVHIMIIALALTLGEQDPFLHSYQVARIQALFGRFPDPAYNHSLLQIREDISNITFLAGQWISSGVPYDLSGIESNLIVTCMFSYWGIGITVLILIIMAYFLIKAFHISIRQKNQLGSIISIGCVSALLLKSIIYVCTNLGIAIPFSQMSMPFLSFGLLNNIVNSVLAGLLLSVFRNTDIVSEKMIRPKYVFRLPIQKVE